MENVQPFHNEEIDSMYEDSTSLEYNPEKTDQLQSLDAPSSLKPVQPLNDVEQYT